VKLVKVPLAPSARIALPPVAWVNCAALTVIAGLVFAVFELSERSLAVMVNVPLVLNAKLKLCVPETSAALDGSVAVASVAVMPTLSAMLLTKFQFASTALTVTLKLVKALWAVEVPVFPLAVPGAAVSPGTNNCNFANAPTPTETLELVLGV